MPRAKGGSKTRQRRKKILKQAKGYFGGRSKLYKTAAETVLRAGAFAYSGRKQKKREARSLWIVRINAACRQVALVLEVHGRPQEGRRQPRSQGAGGAGGHRSVGVREAHRDR